MDDMDIRKKALAQLMGDMDGLEGDGMFPKDAGAPSGPVSGLDVTISVEPKHGETQELKSEAPGEEDEGEEMNDDEMRGLPPFLRNAMRGK